MTSRRPEIANPRQQEKATQNAAESARRAGDQTAENANRFGRAAAETGEHVARVGADVFQNNAEAVQNCWRSSIDIATKMTQRSADQFALAFGFSGDDAQQTMQRTALNVEAIFQSTGALAQGISGISREWFDFVREWMENNFNSINELWRCRTP